jgi:hypothetical protein
LTKDRAEDYVVKYHLDSAKIMRCWNEEVVNNIVNKRVEQRMQDLVAMQHVSITTTETDGQAPPNSNDNR